MRVILSVGNVISVTLIAFLGIVGFTLGMKFLGNKNIPGVSSVANGLDAAWTNTVAA